MKNCKTTSVRHLLNTGCNGHLTEPISSQSPSHGALSSHRAREQRRPPPTFPPDDSPLPAPHAELRAPLSPPSRHGKRATSPARRRAGREEAGPGSPALQSATHVACRLHQSASSSVNHALSIGRALTGRGESGVNPIGPAALLTNTSSSLLLPQLRQWERSGEPSDVQVSQWARFSP